MIGSFRKFGYMIILGYRYIFIFKNTYLSSTLSDADKLRQLSTHRQSYSNKVLDLLNVTVTFTGNIPKHNQVLYVLNHRSLLDILVVENILQTQSKSASWIAKQELIDKYYGKFFLYSGCIGVDIENKRSLLSFFKKIKHNLSQAEDMNLIIAPEGERFKGEGISSFQSGAEKIARFNKLTVIPIFINDKLEKVFEQSPYKEEYPVEVFIGESISSNNIEEEYTQFMQASLASK